MHIWIKNTQSACPQGIHDSFALLVCACSNWAATWSTPPSPPCVWTYTWVCQARQRHTTQSCAANITLPQSHTWTSFTCTSLYWGKYGTWVTCSCEPHSSQHLSPEENAACDWPADVSLFHLYISFLRETRHVSDLQMCALFTLTSFSWGKRGM